MWFKISVLTLVLVNTLPIKGNNVCDTHGKILTAGYPAEKYDLVTEDGYILEVNRIPRGMNQTSTSRRPLVFMMHGLFASATSFVALGPKYAMAFNLADAGFDVWLGNARGVCNSRRHKFLDPDDRNEKVAFFDFTWDDIGLYDLPVMIDFALRTSGRDKLHYIGHSQGATAFMVLNSVNPQYNTKFISAHLLAGVGYKNNFPNKFLRSICTFTNPLWNAAKVVGIVEVDFDWIFTNFTRSVTNDEIEDIMEEKVSIKELKTNASLKQLAHFGQNIKDEQFRRWDYSPFENLMVYGSWSPPKYDLSKINVDIVMHYTVADTLLDERDVLAMVKDLPKARSRRIAKETFSHTDFVGSSYVKRLVTDYIIDKLRR